MEKTKQFTVLTVIVVFISVLLGVNTASARTKRLSLSHIFPASHFVHTRLTTQWAQDVEKVTKGAVKIDVYPGATLLKPAETYEGVMNGTVDIAHGICGYTRGRFPMMEGVEIAGIPYDSAAASTRVALEVVDQFDPKEWKGTKLLVINSVGPGFLFTKKKITSLDQLKGMRIRATGSTVEPIKALGAIPVAMPNNDTYEALSKGVVDGNIGPPEMLKGWKQADVTDYITFMPPVYNSIMYIVMNLEKWNSLPEDVQEAIEGLTFDWSLKTGQIWDDEQKANGIDYGLAQGMKINRMSDDDYVEGTKLMRPIIDEYIGRIGSKGVNGEELIDFVTERSAYWSVVYPSGI